MVGVAVNFIPLPHFRIPRIVVGAGRGLATLGKKVAGIFGRVFRRGGRTSATTAAMSPDVAAGLVRNAQPVGSALKNDPYHRAASLVVDDIAERGHVFRIRGRDGLEATLIQMPGEISGVAGRFEWIVDHRGNLTHQLFVKGGSINGIPTTP
ncbi:MAG TPA: hypothetical protein VHN37_02045 [Actinomycetota bacterium]|nr:hypothetical protein [Actinomycetota bacterium]